MRATQVRVQNFRNIEDSGWVPLDKVTALVGRNESGKTGLLKAIHKFNPGTREPYFPQREFPRDRYTREYEAGGAKGERWPVCSIEFEVSESLRARVSHLLHDGQVPPKTVIGTRYYDGHIEFTYEPPLPDEQLSADPIKAALENFASSARRIEPPEAEPPEAEPTEGEKEETIAALRTELARWATEWGEKLKGLDDLRSESGKVYLSDLLSDVESKSEPATATMVEELLAAVRPVLDEARTTPLAEQVDDIVESSLPVFIYFEDYGVLNSEVYLPGFLQDLSRDKFAPRVRTINAMFKYGGIDPQEITDLGVLETTQLRSQGQQPTDEGIAADRARVDRRAILLSSASNSISEKFSDWWSQRRHKIRYQADGEYFRIWVADDVRPDVEIELESRSKGFQWFFSFYLVFLVESDEGHKDAVLLLDEPGLHLHPTAQQELIKFFETLAMKNQVVYTTHLPFLIDGERLHRVRPVTEDETGHSRITIGTWPEDRETIFPLQAAAGYAMIRGLFTHRRNVLVEGMSDFYYLQALSQQCADSDRAALPDDIYLTPCGGTKNVGMMASLFLSHDVRPLVILDGDDAGRARKNILMRALYAGHASGVLMLDDALGRAGDEVEIEDILDAGIVLAGLQSACGISLTLEDQGESTGSLPARIEAEAERQGVELPVGWKASVALHLVASWAEQGTTLSNRTLDAAASLFGEISKRFEATSSDG